MARVCGIHTQVCLQPTLLIPSDTPFPAFLCSLLTSLPLVTFTFIEEFAVRQGTRVTSSLSWSREESMGGQLREAGGPLTEKSEKNNP